jgi:hypothetical protein
VELRGIRTPDLLNAKQVLFQVRCSYSAILGDLVVSVGDYYDRWWAILDSNQ